MKNSIKIKRLVGIATLAAIVIVLQLTSSYLPKLPGDLSLSLVLVPIVIGAILYGPVGGAILGFVFAFMVLIDPSTAVFYEANIFATICIVIIKSTLAGFVAGLLFKLIYKFNFYLAIVVAAIVTPCINTGIFVLGASMFFRGLFGGGIAVIVGIVGANFLVELGINVVLCPAIAIIIRTIVHNYNVGTNLDESAITGKKSNDEIIEEQLNKHFIDNDKNSDELEN